MKTLFLKISPTAMQLTNLSHLHQLQKILSQFHQKLRLQKLLKQRPVKLRLQKLLKQRPVQFSQFLSQFLSKFQIKSQVIRKNQYLQTLKKMFSQFPAKQNVQPKAKENVSAKNRSETLSPLRRQFLPNHLHSQ